LAGNSAPSIPLISIHKSAKATDTLDWLGAGTLDVGVLFNARAAAPLAGSAFPAL
jgi:hypothetical protein